MPLFRANPLIELQPFRESESDPDLCALFVPKPPLQLTLKAAARPAAELFHSLATPRQLDLDDDLADLVLDGILEIECDEGFLSGADALSLLGVSTGDVGDALSRDALLHAQELETGDAQTLAMALYRYNHIPITPFWKTRFAGHGEILAHVGADRGTLRAMLERDWTLSAEDGPWLIWMPLVVPLQRQRERATYKLYVSPRPERLRDAFEVLVRVLAPNPMPLKLGSNVAGLLRPDKLVAYFATREQLDDAAATMQRELAGCDAHGVPFTASLDEHGLLSWGVDPPETERVLRTLQRNSWRLWLVQRLGGAMAIAKHARTASALEPWRFALARIERHGVDVGRWMPAAALWETA